MRKMKATRTAVLLAASAPMSVVADRGGVRDPAGDTRRNGQDAVPKETYDILGAHTNMSDGFAPRHRRRCSGTLHLNAAPKPVYFKRANRVHRSRWRAECRGLRLRLLPNDRRWPTVLEV